PSVLPHEIPEEIISVLSREIPEEIAPLPDMSLPKVLDDKEMVASPEEMSPEILEEITSVLPHEIPEEKEIIVSTEELSPEILEEIPSVLPHEIPEEKEIIAVPEILKELSPPEPVNGLALLQSKLKKNGGRSSIIVLGTQNLPPSPKREVVVEEIKEEPVEIAPPPVQEVKALEENTELVVINIEQFKDEGFANFQDKPKGMTRKQLMTNQFLSAEDMKCLEKIAGENVELLKSIVESSTSEDDFNQ